MRAIYLHSHSRSQYLVLRAQDDQNPVPLLFIKIFRNWFLFLNKPDGDFRLRWQLSATHQ